MTRTSLIAGCAVFARARVQYLGLAACLAFATASPAAELIRVGGTGGSLETMRLLGSAFTKAGSAQGLNVLPSLGSSGALRALTAGAIDVALVNRPLKPEELAAGLTVYEYGRSPFVFVTSMASARELSRSAVADMLSGQVTKWPDGTQVRPVLRPATDSDSLILVTVSPQIDAALKLARARQGLIVALTDQESADHAEKLPGSLATSTLALLLTEKRKLNVLALDGMAPSVQALAQTSYPYHKRFFIVTRADAAAPVQRFVAFVKSPPGRAILEAHGHLVPN